MSAEKKHDYHLVDPSPWPIYVSFSCLILAIGSVYYLHSEVSWGMYLGLALLLYGMTLFIASEVMFFVAWFWAYFDASLFPSLAIGGIWPPKDIVTFDPWDIPLINTLILLLSGTTVTWSHHALLEGDRKSFIQGLVLTVILGFSFSLLQVYEYQHATFDFAGNIYGSVFYMATGFHGFHVIIGTIFLVVCLMRARKGHFTEEHHFGFEAAAWYWHFVDVVWLFLFAAIYIWGS